ncbi:AHH domain-containing protein [Pyxidicoccus xibeiensis]|uniref:AHH domain-containing protein n=1 Tax=Pyxidicoccus xibeiensis TaxID=2906759 RepID=UPI0020A78879|nr:AHH domain-containing protein [Pyxidicoccus xibeiensis]MCP3139215.1 AHH domain-containing protein [Pyxidicoccus xibeiensis]
MTLRRAVGLLLLLVGTGCSTTRVVRLHIADEAPLLVIPFEEEGAELREAEVDDDEFQETMGELARDVRPFIHPLREARALFGIPERSGVYWYEGRSQRLIPLAEDARPDGPRLLESYADEALTRAYGRWCERKDQPGDCLRLLDEGPLLASDGKYTLAMAIAMDSVWDETAESLRDMADPQALLASVTAAVSMYLLLWALPEPFSKGVAALITAAAIAYLGVDTVWRLLDGWVTLVRKVDRVTTFDELSEAGEEYGAVLGESAARVFVMLATAAIGNTAGLAAKASRLPGSAQAALAVESQAGYSYAAIGSVESVAMTAEGFTIALAPNAVAMAVKGKQRRGTHNHHLATDKNNISTAQGGPWTPQFKRIFKKAGMKLGDRENIVPVDGHQGPHPRAYHDMVFRRLNEATEGCRNVDACRQALTAELRKLSREAMTRGSDLNMLLTRGKSR